MTQFLVHLVLRGPGLAVERIEGGLLLQAGVHMPVGSMQGQVVERVDPLQIGIGEPVWGLGFDQLIVRAFVIGGRRWKGGGER